ncbi:MAG: exodeoxyribonuclease VII large subunit, partial [SAR324 cluster bacterium]|nr:exodeoxyribonuclease VII large subunit [SAR324 cluster bacterium]
GIHVLCHGKPTIYQKTGRLQIVIHRMLPAGEGLLQQKFFELKKRLGDEGLFASDRKRRLPFFPKSIGVVTSGSGAVIHDIMVKIRERMPSLRVYLVDVRVQGEGAADEIADAIELLNESKLVEVIIVARGGGSLEDLWAFNEEKTVRAIAASKIPVISGVGHEVDITLADLAADERAPTPTAAAEMVVPKRDELLLRLLNLSERLDDTDRWIQPRAQALDELSQRLGRSINIYIRAKRTEYEKGALRLKSIEPQRVLALLQEKLSFWTELFHIINIRSLEQRRNCLKLFSGRLEALSPKRVLERGFAIIQSKKGIVTHSKDVVKGEELAVLLAKGSLAVSVDSIFEDWNDLKRRDTL